MKHRHKTHTAGYNTRILSSNTYSILLKSTSILSKLRGSSAQCTLSDKLLARICNNRVLTSILNCYLYHYITLTDCVHYILPLGNFPEDGVLPVQMRLKTVGNEELTSVSTGTGIGHGK